MDRYVHFQLETAADVRIVLLRDSTLHSTILITELHDELLEFVEQETPHWLLVDFRMVGSCSTAVINCLLRAKKRVIGRGGQVKLCNLCRQVREAYRTLNLDGTVFQIHSTRDEAVAAFHAGS